MSTPPAKKHLWGNLPPNALVIVDTAPFIYILQAHPKFADKFIGLFENAAKHDLTIGLSTITLTEILTGPFKAGETAVAKRYEKMLSCYRVIPVTVPIASLAAQLRAQFRLKLPDSIQLATALDAGATAFVTHDRDFSTATGIKILTGD
jgi:predicted nucleic acid-binding protein